MRHQIIDLFTPLYITKGQFHNNSQSKNKTPLCGQTDWVEKANKAGIDHTGQHKHQRPSHLYDPVIVKRTLRHVNLTNFI